MPRTFMLRTCTALAHHSTTLTVTAGLLGFGVAPLHAQRQTKLPVGHFRSGDRATADIASDGTMQIDMRGPTPARWTSYYRTHADTIWVSDRTPACAASGEGRYRWTYDGTTLTLVPQAEPCEPRLASGMLTWVRTQKAR